MSEQASRITGEVFEKLIYSHFRRDRFDFRVESMAFGSVRLRLGYQKEQLRPGGTIAGPIMFTLADTVLYALVMSVVGMVPQAVTTDLSIRFLARPGKVDLIAEGRLLKRSGRLMVGEATIWSDGQGDPVAHATGTYAVPRPAPVGEEKNP